jgi:L-ascorbate metabolism protein UlaG (beta-lactamase superfamily)
MIRPISTLVLLLQVGSFGAPVQAVEPEATNVQLTILANEGLLIQSADSAILIDALIEIEESKRTPEAVATVENMLAGRPPFSSIRLAIVSHPHREHFDAVTAGRFLKNNAETVLVSTEEVIRKIREEYAEYPAIRNRLREVNPDEGVLSSLTVAGIKLDFMLINHEAKDFYPERVLIPIIQLGGKKILYLGDSEIRPGNWEPYNLKAQAIDTVVLPLWLFKEELLRATIDAYVAPKRVVVAQIPLGGLESVLEFSKTFPDIVFLSAPMASTEF